MRPRCPKWRFGISCGAPCDYILMIAPAGGNANGELKFKGARGYGAAAITLKPLCSVATCVPVRRRLLTLLDCCSSDHRLKPVLLEEGEKQVPRLGSAAATKKDRKNGHGCPVPLRALRWRSHIDAEKGSEFMGLGFGRRRCSTRFRQSRRSVRLCVARTITRHAGQQHLESSGLRHRRAR